jgi:hypothetical protein
MAPGGQRKRQRKTIKSLVRGANSNICMRTLACGAILFSISPTGRPQRRDIRVFSHKTKALRLRRTLFVSPSSSCSALNLCTTDLLCPLIFLILSCASVDKLYNYDNGDCSVPYVPIKYTLSTSFYRSPTVSTCMQPFLPNVPRR